VRSQPVVSWVPDLWWQTSERSSNTPRRVRCLPHTRILRIVGADFCFHQVRDGLYFKFADEVTARGFLLPDPPAAVLSHSYPTLQVALSLPLPSPDPPSCSLPGLVQTTGDGACGCISHSKSPSPHPHPILGPSKGPTPTITRPHPPPQ
jgi:hypothetical protein